MNDNDFKELWLKHATSIPDIKVLVEKAAQFKSKNLRRLIIANVLLLLTTAFILFIWYYYQPVLITTKIGIILTVLAMILYMLVYNQLLPLLMPGSYNLSSSRYLEQLLQLKKKKELLQTTVLNVYFLLLSTGICLYMLEYTSAMNPFWRTVSYGLTLIWIALNWFYFRPKSIKKQQAAINSLINKFEELNKQMQERE